ncbi:MAG: cation:proton antiporter [Planctomycetales bacterium]|nr:cation:proton antiporter [Planctomycetales bacterium]
MHDHHAFLQTLVLVLGVGAVTTVLFQWLRQPVVLGYLLAGMVVGPHVPIPIQVADPQVVQTLAELGVILLMFSLGIEFSLPKLMRVGGTAGFVGIVQCSFMVWIGYLTGQAFGWSKLASVYAGAVIAISSTTIIVKAFEEQKIKEKFTQIVFGILIVEDLIAILLLTFLRPLGGGGELSSWEVAMTIGKLFFFLILFMVIGLLTVPRIMRAVVKLGRHETTIVTSIGTAFGLAFLAEQFEYSAALGAFLAGSLVAESGVEKTIEELVEPVRDVFAAIFFVSVGTMIDPRQIAEHWFLVLTFILAVVFGKIFSVTLGCLLWGRSLQTSLKCGMSLAQIGEFSFIIASVGIATKATDGLLYSVAVAASGITTLLTPWLIRASDRTAAFVDRKLPRRIQTFLGLYGSWIAKLGESPTDPRRVRIRRFVRWLAVDTAILAVIVVGASLQMQSVSAYLQDLLGVPLRVAEVLTALGALAIASPFLVGMLRMARFVGFEIANLAFPPANKTAPDLAAAPRRLLVVTVQLAIVVVVGLPLVAITQPFLPPLQGAVVLVLVLALLAISFWRGAANFQGHAKAAAQLIAEALAKHTRDERAHHVAQNPLAEVNRLMTGLGSAVPLLLQDGSPAVGKTLAELNLRGLTGATIVAIQRGGDAVLVPAGSERLTVGDLLAVTGTEEALEAARQMLEPVVAVAE